MTKTLVAILTVLLLAGSLCGQEILDRYVDTDVSGGAGDGTSWANAYSTLNAAVDALAQDLVTAKKILRVNVRGATNADTAYVSTSGYTTSSSYYLWITVDSEDRHAGVWSNSKYRLVVARNYDAALTGLPNYTRIEGLQIRNTGTNSRTVTANSILYFHECILRGGPQYTVYVTADGSRLVNCIIYGGGDGVRTASNYGITLVNCTIANCTTYGVYQASNDTCTAINCYSGGNGTADWAKAGTLSLTNCYSADGTQGTSQVALDTDCFVNVTAGSENLHLVSGSGLIGQGSSTASTYISIDIDGESRPMGGTWDVGADEFTDTTNIAIFRRRRS